MFFREEIDACKVLSDENSKPILFCQVALEPDVPFLPVKAKVKVVKFSSRYFCVNENSDRWKLNLRVKILVGI